MKGETKMAELDLAGTRARAEAASDGPWRTMSGIGHVHLAVIRPAGDAELGNWMIVERVRWRSDAEYIAGMDPATALALLDEVERLTRDEDSAREWMYRWQQRADRAEAEVAKLRARVAELEAAKPV